MRPGMIAFQVPLSPLPGLLEKNQPVASVTEITFWRLFAPKRCEFQDKHLFQCAIRSGLNDGHSGGYNLGNGQAAKPPANWKTPA
jgi:hypothetical protein